MSALPVNHHLTPCNRLRRSFVIVGGAVVVDHLLAACFDLAPDFQAETVDDEVVALVQVGVEGSEEELVCM